MPNLIEMRRTPALILTGPDDLRALGSDPATRAYAERRPAEGKSNAEIIRCLKRYVAREVYPHLRRAGG